MSNQLLADPVIASVSGWQAGMIIGVILVAVVVILVLTIITLAYKIGQQAARGSRGMLAAYDNTMAVWELRDVNRSATGLWRAAESARKILEAK